MAETEFDTAEILQGIREWVEIETPTDDAAAVNRLMDLVSEQYRALGAETRRIPGEDGFGDHLEVRSPWGGDGPCLLVLSHLDTVHPMGSLASMPFRVEGDSAYGPGIYDMKGGAHLGFAAFRALVRDGRETPLPLRFLYTSEEEVGSPVSRRHIEAAARGAKYVIVTEPARDGGRIVTNRKGTARFELRVRGRASHSGGYHQLGRSAIRELARQILDLEAMTDYETGLTVNVGVVAGGTRPNVVPEHAHALIDMRVPSREVADAAIAKVRGLKPYDPDIVLTVDGELERPPYAGDMSDTPIFHHAAAVARDIGFELAGTYSGGGSDGNFTAAMGIPTLDGIGVDGKGAHTSEEQLYVSSLAPRAIFVRRLLETLS